MSRIQDLLRDSAGVTSIEYAAIAALISIVALSTISVIGTTVASLFESVPSF